MLLEKYVKKTEYKNVEGKEIEYALEKAKFNSLYGMSVTNNIKDEVIFDNNKYILEDINKYGLENVTRIDDHLKICINIIKQIKFEYENGGF